MFPLLMRFWSSMELTRVINAKRKNLPYQTEWTHQGGWASVPAGCHGVSWHIPQHHRSSPWCVGQVDPQRRLLLEEQLLKLEMRQSTASSHKQDWDLLCMCLQVRSLHVSKVCLLPKWHLPVSLLPTKVWWDLNLSHFIILHNNLWFAICVTEHTGIWLPRIFRNLKVSHSVCIANLKKISSKTF